MIDYAQIAADALAAIQEAGTTATLARIAKTFDPVTGAVSLPVATKGTIDCVILPARSSDLPENMSNTLSEALVKGKLRKLLIAASGAPFEPEGNDIAAFGSVYWILLACTPLAPAGTPVIYTAIVERTNLSTADAAAIA